MAACTEESVSTVQTKKLKEKIDIKEVKYVKCSPDNSCLLVQRLDLTLSLVYIKTGWVNLISKEVKEFFWSTPAMISSPRRNLTFSILRNNGNVEVYEIKEESLAAKESLPEENSKEKAVFVFGALSPTTLKTLLGGKAEEMTSKSSRLVNCKQGPPTDEDRIDYVTLLIDGYLLVVLSFSVLQSPEVFKCFEMLKHIPAVPFLLPQETITDIKASVEMLYILYEHGILVVYDLKNCTFHGWIDVFMKTDVTSDAEVIVLPKRPSTKILDVDENTSTVFICDDSNNVVKIHVDSYYKHFPSHLHSRDDVATRSRPREKQDLASVFDDQSAILHDVDKEHNLLGDALWRSEVLSISRQLECSTKTDVKSRKNVVRGHEIGEELKRLEQDDLIDPSSTLWSVLILPPPWMENFTAAGLYCSSGSFVLWLKPKKASNDGDLLELNHGVLCCYLESKEDYVINLFMEETMVASGGLVTRPFYLLTSTMIGLAVFDTSQNELVNKIIMYENVAMAEKLCHLNNWDHFAVPISALEAALKHEQLDTVAFYLKTKGRAFTTIATESEGASSARAFSPLSPSSFHTRQLYSKPAAQSEEVLGQITGVVNLLVDTIKTSSKRKHSVQFTSQLLQMSFDYVNGLMQDAVNYVERELGSECDRDRIQDILSFLTAKTMELRWFLYGIPPWMSSELPSNTKEKELPTNLPSETQQIIFEKWTTMDDKDVIQDAILRCQIPLAQVYFLNQERYSAHDGSLRYIIQSGISLVLEMLAGKDITNAIAMLKNMGENVIHVIRSICLNTFDRPLRDYLVEQLNSWGELRQEEINAVKFLTLLEGIYNSQSFESCQIQKLQSTGDSFSDLGLLQKSFDVTETNSKSKSLETGSIAPQYHAAMVSSVSGAYCEILLSWVIGWNQETRERILFEKLVHDENAKSLSTMVSEKSCWQYFKAHSETKRIIEWISSTAETSLQDLPPLTSEVFSDLSECSSFLREVVLDELTRNGLYSTELLTNFPLLLRHFCRTGRLFTKVGHPLDEVARNDFKMLAKNLREQGKETVYSTKLFHEEMIEHCSRHNFMNLLYFYLDFYRLGQTMEEAKELVPKNVDPQVLMLLKFRLAGLSPSDPSVICASSLSNSSVVLSTSNPSLINMLSNHRPIMAIATCLYAPLDLTQIMQTKSGSENHDIWQMDEAFLKSTLSCYPKLYSALFPRSANEKLGENPDITLYELLQGNCSFEVSNLFAWQSTNNLAARGGVSSEMPHFSQKALVDKFAHKETLTYVYFLKHGRPSFAYITYMSKYQHRKFIPKASISKATRKAYQLAIAHFSNNRIAYSCVSFLELLGVDTTFLRIDIEASRRILYHGNKEELQCTTTDDFKNVVVTELLKATGKRQRKPKSLVAVLEIATRNLISKEGLDRTSREASQFWSLPIMFCRSHNMTLTSAFLIDCAKADKWLAFICHAQSAQFPKNQVLSVVQHYFETNNLKEHLHHALVNVVTVNMKVPGNMKRKTRSTPTARDVRSQYLSRVIGASPVGKSEPSVIPQEKNEGAELSSEGNEAQKETEVGTRRDLVEGEGEEEEDESETEYKTTNEMMAASVTDLNPETSPDNLFDVLSLCNETKQPWRAVLAHSIALKRPLFAVLAACYEDANLVDCVCAWLYSQHAREETLHQALMNISDVQWHRWTLDDLLALILTISKLGAEFSHLLAKAFYLFDPNNVMLPLMRFYETFSIHVDFVAAADQLSEFVLQHKAISINEDRQRQMIIGDLVWCEKVSSGVVLTMLRSCETMYMQVHLLRLLCHCKYGNGFSINIPDFHKLYKISQVLEEGKVFAHSVDLLENGTESERILEELLHHQRFAQARDYAILLTIPRDKISLQQVILKKENMQASRLWENERERISFWESCDRYLEEQECATAGNFFEEESKSSCVSLREKATLLCLALNWLSGRRRCGTTTSKTQDLVVELEIEMWLCIINDRAKSADEGQTRTSLHKFTCCDVDFNLVQERFLKIEGNCPHTISDEKMQLILKDIIEDLLDEGHVTQARRLSVLFGISTTDLDIVLSCIFLAEDIRLPEHLEENMKTLSSRQERQTLSNSLKLSGGFMESLSLKSTDSGHSQSNAEDGLSVWSTVGDTLARMQDLASSCRAGKICCSRVIVAYKICQTLGLDFDKVVSTDPFELLCSLLGSSFDQRYQLATQYIKAFNLDSSKIAHFVAKSISTSLSVYAGSDALEDNALIFNPASREDMNNVVNLSEDKLILGGFLFEEALLLAKRRKTVQPSSSALTIEVELLICAHHCQTLACNTEGISSILKLAKLCTRALADANKYQLMVRLLTGIGRFGEMTYIFQTLMDHHHFELLIQKNFDNENKLKIALLNYLDKYHIEDTEKRSLVAYRFNMHREVAISLKSSADAQVKELVERGLSASNEVRSQLVSIAQSYSYAMENFKKDGCLLQALECAKKHRLVELQKQRLPTGMVILDLNDKSLSDFLAQYNNFFECYIVADAYKKRSLEIWAEPLFKHVIIKGDFNYLNDICSVFPVSNTILSEVVLRYRGELQRNASAMHNMKEVLRRDKDIISRYKLALELGYRDEVESIRKGEAGALVRDTGNLP